MGVSTGPDTDVVVVGAGIVGLATARALLSEGWVAEAVEALRRSEVDGERLPLVQLMAAPGYLPKVAPPERGSQSR